MAENLAPHVVASLARQLRQLATTPPDGISFVPSEALHEIFADVDGPTGTPYEGGRFRLKLVLTKEYPAAPPKGYFLTKIFHPNVSSAGDICVNTLKKDWKSDTTLSHILAVIRCLLIVPFPESSLNDDAGKMFMDSYEEYCRKARLVTSIHALPGRGSGVASAGAGDSSSSADAATSERTGSDGVAASTASVDGSGAGVAVTVSGADASASAPGTLTEHVRTSKGSNIDMPVASAVVVKSVKPAVTVEAAKKKASMKRL